MLSKTPPSITTVTATATESDAPALAALYFTCFTNAAHRRVFPPTPEMHAWWTANLRRKIASGRSVVLKVVAVDADPLPAGAGSSTDEGSGSGSERESDSSATGSGSGSDDEADAEPGVGSGDDADASVGKEGRRRRRSRKGRIVAFAEWELPSSSASITPAPAPAPASSAPAQDQAQAQAQSQSQPQPTPATQTQAPDSNLNPTLPPNLSPSDADLLHRLRAQTTRHREEDMRGVEGGYYYLSILGTNPAYRGQGLGSRLLAWGIARARAEGRQIYLCASREGRSLYVRHGFVRVSEGEVVVEEGGERNWFMVWRG
ncbi:hypothetical protein BO86DRAFT_108595 [Aspergillus japonicus CBS 114.51]|uniref:N-acetyltransferase domain-containing protein n=1 Tax=Aspergillus japonicus CBS 114.51 TaxID=1448312 RepID=A0A8T8X0R0_ASPJA|nr:hypothetical protein BO86DRAFT_108595 [Aspergillus japonicus CBS 114.51]RAH81139.1 hypothetical protein BO86DRAFT_108595 [Aspergillus japonicus CBS 114.51]